VGVHGSRGIRAAAALAALPPRANTNVDTIPIEVWRRVRDTRDELGWTERESQAAAGSAYCGSTFYRHSPSGARLARLAALLGDDQLCEIARSDLLWDRVVGIDALGEQEVFDATVPGTHNFIADGIVVHNSIEQDADVVIFLYRDGEQNADSEVELVKAKIAKHRNGPIGEVPLQFRKSTTRFHSVVREESVAAF
jgi:replicative DNA helicase